MEEDGNDENSQNSNEDTDKDTSNSDNTENDDGNDNVSNTEEDDGEENMMTDSPNNDDNSNTMNPKCSQEIEDSGEGHESVVSMKENESTSQEGSQEQNEEDINAEIIDERKGNLEICHGKSFLVNKFEFLPLTYQRGSRQVFSASKRQGTLPSTLAQRLDKGKEKTKKDKKFKGGKKTTQKPQFIDLDSDNEDEEVAARLLLQSKDAQIREWERDFEMAKHIIQYYKDEHKYFKKIKRGLAL